MATRYFAIIAVLFVILFISAYDQNVNAQISSQTLSNSTITAIINGFNPAIGPIPTTSYASPSGCPMPPSSTSQGSINKIKCGLYALDPLNNVTMTQQQLQANQKYWIYGGDAPGENAPYAFYEDSQGLHIGVQAPSSGTYAGFYAVTPNTNAMLFHAVITSPSSTIPNNFFQTGMYVQTSQPPVNYVTCVAITSNFGTIWAVVHTYGGTSGSLVFQTLWFDNSANQPVTRDCTIITNGQNYLKVYLDGNMVYYSDALALGMPAPFNAFLESQTSYNGSMLFATYKDFYSALNEDAVVVDNPSSATTAEVMDSSGNVLSSAPVILGNATINIGKYHLPINANIKVLDSNNVQIASTPVIENVYGGDVYSVMQSTATASSTSSGTTTSASSYSGRAVGLSVNTSVLSATFADTGPLPPQGGEVEASGLNLQTPQAQADGLISVTMGFNNVAQSDSTTSDVSLLPGTSDQITADFVRSDSSATCSGDTGSSEISNLTLAGQQINISGSTNQTVTIPGVLTLIINEQIQSSLSGSNSITVNALDLKLASGGQVLVSSASSGIVCNTPQTTTQDFMTGGGYIIVNNKHANFGFVAGYKPNQNTISGQLNYVDKNTGMHVKSVDITSYSGSGNTRTFSGQATINGVSGYIFTVTATDNGEPGAGKDNFSIQLSNGYSASGVLAGGNIKLHT